MRIACEGDGIEEVCRHVEERLRGVDELRDVEVRVVVLPDFSTVPKMGTGCMGTNPAFYDARQDIIFVDGVNFPTKKPGAQEAVLAHEIAHLLRARTNAPPVKTTWMDLAAILGEEIVADATASRWGYGEELATDRAAHYEEPFGSEYASLLRSADAPDFAERAYEWEQNYRAKRKKVSRP